MTALKRIADFYRAFRRWLRHITDIVKNEAAHVAMVAELKAEHGATVEALRIEHQRAVQSLRDEFYASLEAAKDALRNDLSELREAHDELDTWTLTELARKYGPETRPRKKQEAAS